MENNSNDTLFGFTAITDIFTEQVVTPSLKTMILMMKN